MDKTRKLRQKNQTKTPNTRRPKSRMPHDTEHSTGESAEVQAARRDEAHVKNEAARARSDSEAAQREAEQAAEVLARKEQEVAEVKAKLAAVDERVANLRSDAPEPEKIELGSLGWFLERRLRTTLEPKRAVLQESLVAAQQQAAKLQQRAEAAEATARNAQRWVELQRLREQFPPALDTLLRIVSERNDLLTAAAEESQAFDLPRLGRARLFTRRDQIRQTEMDELAIILTRHSSGLALVPSGPLGAFTLEQDRNGNAKGSPEEEAEPEPEDGWIDAVLAEQEAELVAGMPLEGR